VKRAQSDLSAASAHQPTSGSVIHPVPIFPPRSDYQSPIANSQRLPTWIDRESRVLPPLPLEPPVHSSTPNNASSKLTVDDTVASTDLQNPADALEFLAHVAERNSGVTQLPPMRPHRLSGTMDPLNESTRVTHDASGVPIKYGPLSKGLLSLEMIHVLLARYEDKYHQFFPLANPVRESTIPFCPFQR
jgi:hypothetical protein